MSTATCHTPDCSNAGIPLDVGDLVIIDDSTGEPFPPMPVYCGVCGHEIEDVKDVTPS